MRHLAGYVVWLTPHKIGGCQDHPGQPWWHLLSLNSPTKITKYFVPRNPQPFFISDVSDALTGNKTKTCMCQKSRLWITLTVKSVDLIFCPDQLIPLLIPYAFNWQTSSSMRILWPHSWSSHRKPLCNQPPPQIWLFDIIFVIDACSLLFQPWNTYTVGTQQNSGFMIQLELDSCISALSYYRNFQTISRNFFPTLETLRLILRCSLFMFFFMAHHHNYCHFY